MKKLFYFSIFIIASSLFGTVNSWSQEKGSVTQGDIARLIGEEMGFKSDYVENLKKRGVTPLGKWDESKLLTKEDFDAILIRISRRDPVIETMEPAKLLDSMGFSQRVASREGIGAILRSDAFKMVIINLNILLSPSLLPLPLGYGPKLLGTASPTEAAIQVTAPAVTVEEAPPIIVPPEPGPDTTQR